MQLQLPPNTPRWFFGVLAVAIIVHLVSDLGFDIMSVFRRAARSGTVVRTEKPLDNRRLIVIDVDYSQSLADAALSASVEIEGDVDDAQRAWAQGQRADRKALNAKLFTQSLQFIGSDPISAAREIMQREGYRPAEMADLFAFLAKDSSALQGGYVAVVGTFIRDTKKLPLGIKLFPTVTEDVVHRSNRSGLDKKRNLQMRPWLSDSAKPVAVVGVR